MKRKYPAEVLNSVKKCRSPYEKRGEILAQSKKRLILTIDQVEEDIADFFNCLKLCYSGYDVFLSDELCDKLTMDLLLKIRHRFRKIISNELLCEYLYKTLVPFIQESHFMLFSGRLIRVFSKPYIAYVSEIILKETNNGFTVIKAAGGIKEGTFLEADDVKEFLLPTLYPEKMENKDDKFFLLGVYSPQKCNFIKIAGKKLKLHRIRSDFASQKDLNRLVDENSYAIANHQSYQLARSQEIYDEFRTEGKICSKKDAVILNLSGNTGGTDYFPENFFDALSGNHDCKMQISKLQNPLTLDNADVEYEIVVHDACGQSNYKGQLFVIMNKNSASSAEDAISMAKQIPGTILVGGASCGCGSYGDCLYYQLPNSKIVFYFGFKLFARDSFEEGKGFIPDYWIDSKNPLKVVEEFIKCKK